jgi:hypothetical protein
MSCSTRPGTRCYLDFIESALGEKITQDEWHAIRRRAQEGQDPKGLKSKATSDEVMDARNKLKSAAIKRINAGELSPDDYNTHNYRMLSAIIDTPPNKGTTLAVSYLTENGIAKTLAEIRAEDNDETERGPFCSNCFSARVKVNGATAYCHDCGSITETPIRPKPESKREAFDFDPKKNLNYGYILCPDCDQVAQVTLKTNKMASHDGCDSAGYELRHNDDNTGWLIDDRAPRGYEDAEWVNEIDWKRVPTEKREAYGWAVESRTLSFYEPDYEYEGDPGDYEGEGLVEKDHANLDTAIAVADELMKLPKDASDEQVIAALEKTPFSEYFYLADEPGGSHPAMTLWEEWQANGPQSA